MDQNLLDSPEIKHIHLIGIGGISMSALAEILLHQGYKVSGSDAVASRITKRLEEKGAKVFITQNEKNIQNPDLVVYSAAVKETNPELSKARKTGVPVIDRATLLGEIMKKYPFSVAISGTHGKTTTTSMISMIMLEEGLDPTIHVGGELDAIGGNVRLGGNKYFITEACEYCESFLKFHPYIGLILNIEADHLDYYRDLDHIKDSFLKFTSLISKDGCLVACCDEKNVEWLLDKVSCRKITYGIKSPKAGLTARDVAFDELGYPSYTLVKDGQEIERIKLSVQGIHNVSNSLAAAACCLSLGCSINAVKSGLYSFTGTHRRFEVKGSINGITVVDDYAHHPTEIKATLKAAKNCAHSRIWCVFQPHTYSRTKLLLDDFANAFSDADSVIVADIYASRESDNGDIHSSTLVDRINSREAKAVYISDFDQITGYLADNASPGDLVITMGAGDIYRVGELFLKERKRVSVS